MQRWFGQSRIVVPSGGHAFEWLRDALAALPEPWTVLANRRRSGAEGPPWVRYVVLHPGKGIALVDVDPAEFAVAPLEDFIDHTGLAAFQSDALPIVAVTLPKDGAARVADAIEAAFAGCCCQLGNPYWCEAVVELLLTTPELSLTRLRRTMPPILAPAADVVSVMPSASSPSEPPSRPTPTARVDVPAPTGPTSDAPPAADPPPVSRAPTVHADAPGAAPARWRLGSKALPLRSNWRSWPTSPVTVAAAVLAFGAVVLVSHQASSPTREASSSASMAVAATPTPTKVAPVATTVTPKPPSEIAVATVPPAPTGKAASTQMVDQSVAAMPTNRAAPSRAPRHKVVRRPADNRAVEPPLAPPPAPREQRLASARVVSAGVCADFLHPDRPGGWQYHGPPVPGCLPIRFFGLVGMR